MTLTFHQATFDLLGKAPRPSKRAIADLDARERALGFTLPPSLREFYGLAGAADLLTEHSGHDPAVPIEELGEPDDLARGLLRIQDNAQDMASFFVRLDGSDDPPVEVAHETDFDEPPEGVEDWTFWDVARPRRVADRFSDYVHQNVLLHGGDKRDRKAAAKLKAHGGQVDFDDRGRAVHLFFGPHRHDRPGFELAEPLDDAAMGLVRRLDRLEWLDLYRPAAEVGGWAALRGHPALARIQSRGAIDDAAVEHLVAMPALRTLWVGDEPLTDDGLGRLLRGHPFEDLAILGTGRLTGLGLAALSHQAALAALWISDPGGHLDDDALAGLAGLTSLRTLRLGSVRLGDDGLRHLAGLTGLTKLELRLGRITDAGTAHLAGLTALRDLDLKELPLADAALGPLAGLRELEALHLDHTRVEGPGLASLSGLPKLDRLSCHGTPMGDEGMRHLAACPSLRELDLRQTRITDAGLRSLASLQSLRTLDLSETAASAPAIRDLKAAIPELAEVFWSPPSNPKGRRPFDFAAKPGRE